jgi:hypothetical protein
LIDLGTRRDPSLFEFSSTAPAVLGSIQLATNTAVGNFTTLLSTTQLGFQRSIGVEDTYIPGTVPERLYKRAQKAHESDDGVFLLTADVPAPTPKEIRAVEAEVSDEALDRAIDTLKKSVRLSSKQRIDTPKVRENKELGQM